VIEFTFDLLLNSPAFVASLPTGQTSVQHLKKNRDTGENELRTDSPQLFNVDARGIRIPSLRGVLEFWYRSLLGHLPTSGEVFDRQAEIFGSADGGQGLSIRPGGVPRFAKGELSFGGNGEDPLPFLYLGYGPLQFLKVPAWQGDKKGQNIATSYHAKQAREVILLEEKQRARFRFTARGRQEQIEALKQALLLLHLFGGIGARSRRGWGSIEVDGLGLEAPPDKVAPLATWIQENLAKVWSSAVYSVDSSEPAFSAFSRGTQIFTTGPRAGDYKAVLLDLYGHFQRVRSFRSGRPLAVKDHQEEFDDAQLPSQGITWVPRRLAFGMPYQPGHEKRWSIEYQGRLPSGNGDVVTRRASPLLLKVLRLGPNLHTGVAVFLKSQFFGDPRLKIGAKGKDLTLDFPGYEAIDQFFAGSGWTRVPLP
jgi:CRISPR-associated protein Cmr1